MSLLAWMAEGAFLFNYRVYSSFVVLCPFCSPILYAMTLSSLICTYIVRSIRPFMHLVVPCTHTHPPLYLRLVRRCYFISMLLIFVEKIVLIYWQIQASGLK
jgi:hypothetical protein